MGEVRKCSRCSETKPLSQFPKNGKRNGVQRYRASCAQCETQRVAAYMDAPEYREKQRRRIYKHTTKRQSTNPCGSISYRRAHGRVIRLRGAAKAHPCIDCGKQAKEWSLNASASGLKRSALYSWSDSIDDYDPRCVPCHRELDHKPRKGCAE